MFLLLTSSVNAFNVKVLDSIWPCLELKNIDSWFLSVPPPGVQGYLCYTTHCAGALLGTIRVDDKWSTWRKVENSLLMSGVRGHIWETDWKPMKGKRSSNIADNHGQSSGHVWGLRVHLFPFDWTEIVSWKSSTSEDLPVSMRLHFVGFCKVFVYLARQTDGWDFRSDPSRRPTKLWSESLVRRLEKSGENITWGERSSGCRGENRTRSRQTMVALALMMSQWQLKQREAQITYVLFSLRLSLAWVQLKAKWYYFFVSLFFILDLRLLSIDIRKRKAREKKKKKHPCITHWAEQVAGVMRLLHFVH